MKSHPACLLLLSVAMAACAGIEERLQSASAALTAGNYKEAEAQYRQVLQAQPGAPGARDGLAAARFHQEAYDEACPLLRADSDPVDARTCWETYMDTAYTVENWRDVLRIWRRVPVSLRKRSEPLQAAAAEAARARQNWDALLRIYPLLLGSRPDDANVHYLYGRALAQRERYAQARREYELAASLDPDHDAAKRYARMLTRKMERTGTSGAARIEAFSPREREKAAAESVEFRQEKLHGGSVRASIRVEDDTGSDATTATTAPAELPFDVVRSIYPDGVSETEILQRVGRWIRDLPCSAPLQSARVVVTWGSRGTVSKFGTTSRDRALKDCLRSSLRGWILSDMQGGYLRVRWTYPLPLPETSP